MSDVQPHFYIMPAEFVGMGKQENGIMLVGGIEIPWHTKTDRDIAVFVRRNSMDLSVIEVVMATHDGYCQEELDEQNRYYELTGQPHPDWPDDLFDEEEE